MNKSVCVCRKGFLGNGRKCFKDLTLKKGAHKRASTITDMYIYIHKHASTITKQMYTVKFTVCLSFSGLFFCFVLQIVKFPVDVQTRKQEQKGKKKTEFQHCLLLLKI